MARKVNILYRSIVNGYYDTNNRWNSYITEIVSLEDMLSSYLQPLEKKVENLPFAYLDGYYMPVVENALKNSLLNLPYSIKGNLKRYLEYAKKNLDLDISDVVRYVNIGLDYDFYDEGIIQVANIDAGNQVLVNKYHYLLPEDIPQLQKIGSDYCTKKGLELVPETALAAIDMIEDAKGAGIQIRIASAYRSWGYQNRIYNNYVANDKLNADTYSARPGHSEHQTGLAIDLAEGSKGDYNKFGDTEAFNWMQQNGYKYGFILRYPENKTAITGYKYEPWHYRYVGTEVATAMHNYKEKHGEVITFDEYCAMNLAGF